ncbi:MAG: hypothetical protein ACRYFA_04980 [Janthinobacterium lividum]
MKKIILNSILTFVSIFFFTFNADAQFGSLIQKAKQKASDKVGQMMDKKASNDPQTNGTTNSKKIKINTAFDFAACDSSLYEEKFSSNPIGRMPTAWKTNGSGEVVKTSELPGKWLQLQNFASYKLAKLIKYPTKFTVEFDIVAVADKIEDLSPLSFGFAGDNSVRSYVSDAYNDGAINNISLSYYNKNGTIESSSDTKYYHTTDIDLQGFANQIMHVSIAVDGEYEQVYLDKTKISDTKMFNPTRMKYFYISAPIEYKNSSKALFGNFKLMTCK